MTKKTVRTVKDNFDGPWKFYFRDNLRYFLQFADIEAYNQIDWSHNPEFLDKELKRISKGLKKSLVVVDCLVKVLLKNGEERWLLIHIEFQAQRDLNFPERMFIYNFRSYDLYRVPVASYAVLADDNPAWKPEGFGYSFGKSSANVNFGVLKLMDYSKRESELEQSDNPFALAILAHLKTLETRGNPESRYLWKLRLTRMLFNRGWERLAIESLFDFIEWVMRLPEELEDKYEDEIERESEEGKDNAMELMSPRRKRDIGIGRTEGKLEGKLEALRMAVLEVLQARFTSSPEVLEVKVRQIESPNELQNLLKAAATVATLQEFDRMLLG